MSSTSAVRGATRNHTTNRREQILLDRARIFMVPSRDSCLIPTLHPSWPLCKYFLADNYPSNSSGDRRSQAGAPGQPNSFPIRWQWTFLEGSETATLRRAYPAAVCGRSPRPRVGRRYPPPSSGLQMKPLRNAHWSPLKHRLSPLFACLLPFLPQPKRQFDLLCGVL